MTTDPIADLLTRIRNASRAKHSRVDIPASKVKVELARILKEEGYLANFKVVEEQKARRPCAFSCATPRTVARSLLTLSAFPGRVRGVTPGRPASVR